MATINTKVETKPHPLSFMNNHKFILYECKGKKVREMQLKEHK